MIVNQELVKKIKNYFDLNIYETKVWLALLSKGIASAGEIAELSSVPRSRTYDVLEGLEKQGFVIAKLGKPTKYIAIKPTVVLETLKKRTIQSADEKVKVLDKLKGTREYVELESLHNSSINLVKREDISGSIKGRTNILSYAREILENAEKEVIICLPAIDLIEKGRIFNNLFEKLNKQNIKLKIALNGDNEEIKRVQNKYNIKPIKTNTKSKFFIIDKKQLLFTLTDSANEEDELAVWLNTDFFAGALASMFEASLRR